MGTARRMSDEGGRVDRYEMRSIEEVELSISFRGNGAEGIRTPDLLDANEALSQLSHSPQQTTEVYSGLAASSS